MKKLFVLALSGVALVAVLYGACLGVSMAHRLVTAQSAALDAVSSKVSGP